MLLTNSRGGKNLAAKATILLNDDSTTRSENIYINLAKQLNRPMP